MSNFSPLVLKRTIGESYATDPNDILVTKQSLSRLGHYERPDWGLTEIADRALFDGISSFQAKRGLKVDRLMKPEGETATEIGRLLSARKPRKGILPTSHTSDAPTAEQCDQLYWHVDIPTCRAIEKRRGKRAAANCYHTASARYAACLSGTPINELPPLNTWNQ